MVRKTEPKELAEINLLISNKSINFTYIKTTLYLGVILDEQSM